MGKQGSVMYGDTSVLQRTKEQCLVGIKGTLKRSVDTHFIHANCDVDLIMEEEKEFGSTHKPAELYKTIEHFCLGRRRLELFGLDRNLRDGWLTVSRRRLIPLKRTRNHCPKTLVRWPRRCPR